MAETYPHPFEMFCAAFGLARMESMDFALQKRETPRPNVRIVGALRGNVLTLCHHMEMNFNSDLFTVRTGRAFMDPPRGPYLMEVKRTGQIAVNLFCANWIELTCTHSDLMHGAAWLTQVVAQVVGQKGYEQAYVPERAVAA